LKNEGSTPGGKRWPILRVAGMVLGVLVLILGVVGALATLWGDRDRQVTPEPRRQAPPVRQVDPGSLRQDERGNAH